MISDTNNNNSDNSSPVEFPVKPYSYTLPKDYSKNI